MKQKLNKKRGFTLAELLIVVAIIGVLAAISIPVFTTQLEKSRDAVTMSNLRAAYAEAAAEVLTSDDAIKGGTNLTSTPYVITVKGAVGDGKAFLDTAADKLPFVLEDPNLAQELDSANSTVAVEFSWELDEDGEAATPICSYAGITTTGDEEDDGDLPG